MSTSTLFLVAAGCGVLFGALAVYQQLRDGVALGAVRWTEPEPALCTWDSYSKEFTPVRSGPFRLVVTLSTPDVPVLHVRIGDALKTDGHRAPGY
jgi:hypothetical protein